jgi:hypothetical protein
MRWPSLLLPPVTSATTLLSFNANALSNRHHSRPFETVPRHQIPARHSLFSLNLLNNRFNLFQANQRVGRSGGLRLRLLPPTR